MTTRFRLTTLLFGSLVLSAGLWGQEKTNKATVEDLQEQVSELQDDIEKIKTSLNTLRLGSHKILFSGNIRTQFIADEGDPSTFDVLMRFHPYWLVGDRFLAKVDTQFTYKGNKTDVFLFFGEIGYILFPWLTAKAGVMLAPFGFFQENVHVEWVQKMADEPLPVTDDLIAPTQILGFQLRGTIPIVSDFRINYALWLANGPRLNDGTNVTNQTLTSHHGSVVPNHPGSLLFNNNYLDNNDNKTVGGRIAFLPWAPVEFGYSAMYGQVGDKGTRFEKVGAFIHAVDVSFMGVIQPLKSRLE
ncbi:MAG: hypothetical protein JNM63_16330, partial [Spirochaetia bacterium]|nr:hypothetical protein [Spirochaetia bacterium]